MARGGQPQHGTQSIDGERRGSGSTIVVTLLALAVIGAGAWWFLLGPGSTDEVIASPSPTASPTATASAEPMPSITETTAGPTQVFMPASLAWPDSYASGVTDGGIYPPFLPDGDYPGVVPDYSEDWDGTIEGGAPAFFPDAGGFDPLDLSDQEIGQGDASVMIRPIEGGLMEFQLADGTSGAWLVAPVLTDAYSSEPRWAMCRFLLGEDIYGPADAVYCSQMDGETEERFGYISFFMVDEAGVLYETTGLKNSDFLWSMSWAAPSAEFEQEHGTDGVLEASVDEQDLALGLHTVSWEHP